MFQGQRITILNNIIILDSYFCSNDSSYGSEDSYKKKVNGTGGLGSRKVDSFLRVNDS